MIRFAAAVCAVLLGALMGAASLQTADPPPKAVPPKQLDPSQVPPDLADWTPRPAVGKAEPWERATDKDWIDARFREMNTGPYLNCTMGTPRGRPHKTPWTIYKATAIHLSGTVDAAVAFDRDTLLFGIGWFGGFLKHSDRRFGLLNTPTPKAEQRGDRLFHLREGPGWANPDGSWVAGVKQFTAPLPKAWGKYRGLYLNGDRVTVSYTLGATDVLESPGIECRGGMRALTFDLHFGPGTNTLTRAVFPEPSIAGTREIQGRSYVVIRDEERRVYVGLIGRPGTVELIDNEGCKLRVNPADGVRGCKLVIAAGNDNDVEAFCDLLARSPEPADITTLTKPGPPRWGKPLVTDLVRGDESGPFAVDTLTLPYDNPFKALFFCTGLDHLPDGRVAVCTCHGDVWLARIDEPARKVHWQRFATGLYHPLGLKVIDGKIVVLERGQLTRLHDDNNDGEADFYECVNNDWHTGAGEHSYDTCLETDPAGNFYFFKTGDTDLPHGGCLMKVSKDGKTCDVFCTGFRHPIGLGLSPTGIVTGADQEGNWMPATRIDQYKPGGFYGDMRAHHRKDPPKTYDGPLCWLPREVDNSAGGQVWVPENSKWPLAGLPIHFSYGRCKAFVLLRQELPDGTVQGGVADLHVHFLSGVCRGRFHPTDGHLYVCGLNGWQTSAKADGCVQRVRYTGKPVDVPTKMEVVADGVRLTFSRPLDRAKAADPANYRAAWWKYKWCGDYGSKRYKCSGEVGQDDVFVKAAEVSADGRTVFVKIGPMKPVMQMQVGYNVAAVDGKKVVGSVYLTVHQAR